MSRLPEALRATLPTGHSTRVLHWPGNEAAQTALVIHHGLGEHAGRYQRFAERLSPALPIVAFDARGHGEADGARGVVRGMDQLADDLHAVFPDLLRIAGTPRALLYGHSMGAGAVGHYLTTREVHDTIEGVWLSSVPTVVDMGLVKYVQRAAARLLEGVSPDVTLPSGLQTSGISSVAAEVERYQDDPLVHDRASIALGRSLFDDVPRILDRAHLLTRPLLLWHGAEDPIANAEGTRRLFASAGASDKGMNIFDEARHEVHHETESIVGELVGWLDEWLGSRGLVAN